MKILIVNTSDINGGAARAAYRLHHALITSGIDSKMLVLNKQSDEVAVLSPKTKLSKLLGKASSKIEQLWVKCYRNKSATLFNLSILSSSIVNKINAYQPDIVHLHWINSGMLTINDITKIQAPIVWSLHDMWAFTGGCHYDEKCGGYKKNCGNCKVLGSQSHFDISRLIYNKKLSAYSKVKSLTVVGLSRWLQKCAQQSSIFNGRTVVNLPNPIDTKFFKPVDKSYSRSLWQLPKNKKLVLFGAMSATSDPRKGFDELLSAINLMNLSDVELVVFGASKPKRLPNCKYPMHYIGKLDDDISLVTLYSAVDVVVVPSKQENLSNTIMESLACAIPVVAFDIGGNPDLIEHQVNGYLASPFDAKDLARGVEWAIEEDNNEQLCSNAREKVVNEFAQEVVVQQYVSLYKNVINDSGEVYSE